MLQSQQAIITTQILVPQNQPQEFDTPKFLSPKVPCLQSPADSVTGPCLRRQRFSDWELGRREGSTPQSAPRGSQGTTWTTEDDPAQ